MSPRTLLLTALLLSSLGVAKGGPIGKEEASRVANSFLATRQAFTSHHLSLAYSGHSSTATTDDPCYYVFTSETGRGFVIVSGEEQSQQVLGYSDTGTFDAEDIPGGLRYLLDWYADELTITRHPSKKTAIQTTATRAASTSSTNSSPRHAIPPLLTTTWDQKAPYNLKCFMADGTQSLAGCVATAMAQVMNYHEWPVTATPSIPAYTAINGMRYASLPPTTFSWEKMKGAYYPLSKNEDVDASLEAVADLMLYCGHSVEMNYKSDAAGAYTTMIPQALHDIFGFSDEVRELRRSNYNNDVWCDIVYNELLNHRPVLYTGATSSTLTHVFICDGYDGHGLFHINWGAGGKSNGYFSLSSLRPSVLAEEYSAFDNSQRITVGIHPPTTKVDPSPSYLATQQLNTTAGTNTYSKISGVKKSFNYSVTGVVNLVHADAGIGLFSNDSLVEVLSTKSNLRVVRDSAVTMKFTCTFGANLEDGTYEIRGVNRLPGENQWRENLDNNIYFITMEVSNGKAVFTNADAPSGGETSVPVLQVSSFSQVFESGVNPKQIRVVVRNTSNVDFIGTAYLILNNDMSLYEGCFVDAGQEATINFHTDKAAGSYTAKLQAKGNNYNKTFSLGKLTLTEDGSLPILTLENVSFKNISGDIHYGRVIDGSMTLRNETKEDYCGLMSYYIYHHDTDYKYQMSQLVTIKAGESATIPLTFENLEFGDHVSVMDIGDPFTTYYHQSNTWTVTPGFVTWTATGERNATAPPFFARVPETAAAASLEGLSLTGIMPNSNVNTIYYFDRDAIIPASFQGRNVVLGNKAENICLVEGKDYYIPYSFKASYVSATHKPTIGFDGRCGWQTISLPFVVDSIYDTSDSQRQLKWSITTTPSNDGKDLWLRELAGINGDEALFTDVYRWRSNTPYLMAVPDSHWGETCDLVGHTLYLTATNTLVESTASPKVVCGAYEFTGVSGHALPVGAYVLNASGDAFIPASTIATPTSAYLLPMEGATPPPAIHIINHTAHLGDVNGDKEVNIIDVMTTVNVILCKAVNIFIKGNGDLNYDDIIDVSDVMMLVREILSN
ncbi:MAG: C10 family peptidase [Prevotella sp.]|nr:C10 family peptidase [Prevotella sp.]